MAGKLKEPLVITDYRREPVCILPVVVMIAIIPIIVRFNM